MSKGKGFIHEFKTFILRGNVMDLAVGVIIGGAFQKIVGSLVDDVIMPVIAVITGGIDFSNLFVALNGQAYASLKEAVEANAPLLKYGTFITAIINFLIMAFVIFILIKTINTISNKLEHHKEEAPVATTKKCPFCMSEIQIEASRCPNCTSLLADAEEMKEAAAAKES